MLTRRRFLTIAASAAAIPLIPASGLATPVGPEPVVWRGVAMGGIATMILAHPDRVAGQRLVARAVAEIDRLESVFSLYRPNSALSRLNERGVLDDPPLDLVELMAFAAALARETNGAFDPTVQPLFKLYASHFAAADADPAGPSAERIEQVLELVDHRAVEIANDRIRLRRRGMAVTLNGIAQGFITDRVAALLRADGLENMLLDLGELRAAGRHPDGRPWRAGIADPTDPDESLFHVDLQERPESLPALATSGGYGLRFDAAGLHHHLFDPRSGGSASHHVSVSVAAPTALLADGLSTALSVIRPERLPEVLHRYRPVRIHLVDADGDIRELGSRMGN